MNTTEEILEAPPRPAPEAAVRLARAAVKEFYASCFWFRHPDAPLPETEEDVRLVIENLRENGNKQAWKVAQNLVKCL